MASEQPTWMQQQPQAACWAQAAVPTKQVHNPANAKPQLTQPEKARDSAHPEIKYPPSRPLRLRASSPLRPFSVRERDKITRLELRSSHGPALTTAAGRGAEGGKGRARAGQKD
ncbi:hypothetical protein CCUS01_16310 [Colletotrichum cuscutae]|uniref:Uncharacterized protein n=1 Tax=Colletotrichum cuscutae TaxID=1209917 RepID=A0AAI9VAQ5_9PEZI|nr:hypothetical protein CCUS01_16310 [Colletotrichum cuscutae]